MSKLVFLILAVGAVAGPSLSSCGAASDHLALQTLQMTPDPPVAGQPLTIEIVGKLDEDAGNLHVDVDLDINALGIFKTSVKKSLDVSFTPTILVAGPFKVTAGPFSLPSLPGGVKVSGTVHTLSAKKEPIACAKLDLDLGLLAGPVIPLDGEVADPVDCKTPQDHMTGISTNVSADNLTTTTKFTVDEDINKLNVDVDILIEELFFKIPIKIDASASFTPGLKATHYTIVSKDVTNGGQLEGQAPPANLGLSTKGQVKITDAKGEQVTCAVVGSGPIKTTREAIFEPAAAGVPAAAPLLHV
jgi:hypothetical protein